MQEKPRAFDASEGKREEPCRSPAERPRGRVELVVLRGSCGQERAKLSNARPPDTKTRTCLRVPDTAPAPPRGPHLGCDSRLVLLPDAPEPAQLVLDLGRLLPLCVDGADVSVRRSDGAAEW